MQVTNVRVGNDAREVKRRKDDVSAREKRQKRLEDQANQNAEKFNEVNSRWKFILGSNDPLDLYHDIEEQKGKSGSLPSSLLRPYCMVYFTCV
jgi:dynein regulatory complex protein 1